MCVQRNVCTVTEPPVSSPIHLNPHGDLISDFLQLQRVKVTETYLAKNGVFTLQLRSGSHGEEKLTTIVIWACVCHGHKTPPDET